MVMMEISEGEMVRYVVVLVTASNEEEGLAISRALVEEELVACVNMVEKVRSIYKWRGKIEDDAETLLIIKTGADNLPEVITRVKELHSYDVPEVIALPIVEGNKAYLKWIDEVT